MIGKKIQKPVTNAADYAKTALWCNANKALIEDNGDWYEVVEIAEKQLTPEELKEKYCQLAQDMMDEKARERNYDGIMSVCSYATSQHPKFAAEAAACVVWRDAVWSKCYEMLDQVLSGEIGVPEPDAFLAMLPEMEWPNKEADNEQTA